MSSSTQDPWKDADTLRNLYETRTQGEIADHFREDGHDVTASTISYWMNKLEISTSHTSHEETTVDHRECVNYDECGNETPGPENEICDNCLDKARHNE